MSNLIIAISGSGGGNKGPLGIYPLLKKKSRFSFISIDTVQDDVKKNIDKVVGTAKEHFSLYKNIYLMGHSMGGAVAVQAAYQLNQEKEALIKGVILLSTQTDGLSPLNEEEFNLPALFYHGTEDACFPLWEIASVYERCKGRKKMVQIQGAGHNLALQKRFFKKDYIADLSDQLLRDFDAFFLQDTPAEEIVAKEISQGSGRLAFFRGKDFFDFLF